MNYNKPELVNLDSSIKAIQGSTVKSGTFSDIHTSEPGYPTPVTSMAYEADE
jgi:hypothetical protein